MALGYLKRKRAKYILVHITSVNGVTVRERLGPAAVARRSQEAREQQQARWLGTKTQIYKGEP